MAHVFVDYCTICEGVGAVDGDRSDDPARELCVCTIEDADEDGRYLVHVGQPCESCGERIPKGAERAVVYGRNVDTACCYDCVCTDFEQVAS